MFTEELWKRTGEDEMSRPAYIRAIAFFTILVGLFVAGGAVISFDWALSWPMMIVTFVVSIGAIFGFTFSKNPVISFISVAVMCVAMGMMIGPIVALYSAVVVMQALVATAGIMVVMSLIGILYPSSFEGLGPYLMGALTLLIVSQFAQILFLWLGFEQAANMPLLAWVGVGIFTVFVAYDWSRALGLPHTWDNAVDASGGLVLDAINLFIRLLQIFGGKGGSSRR